VKIQPHSKIFARRIQKRVAEWRRAGERIILAIGCFDLLMLGISIPSRGKAARRPVIVAINRRKRSQLKGEGRPLMPEDERAEIVWRLADVDAVVLFPETRRSRADTWKVRPRHPGKRHRLHGCRMCHSSTTAPSVSAGALSCAASYPPVQSKFFDCGSRVRQKINGGTNADGDLTTLDEESLCGQDFGTLSATSQA